MIDEFCSKQNFYFYILSAVNDYFASIKALFASIDSFSSYFSLSRYLQSLYSTYLDKVSLAFRCFSTSLLSYSNSVYFLLILDPNNSTSFFTFSWLFYCSSICFVKFFIVFYLERKSSINLLLVSSNDFVSSVAVFNLLSSSYILAFFRESYLSASWSLS